MIEIYSAINRYLMILFMAFYVLFSFYALKKNTKKIKKRYYRLQGALLYLLHLSGFSIIYLNNKSEKIIIFYGLTLLYFVLTQEIYKVIYPKTNRILLNNMCFLINIGMLMLIRISYERAVKQFVFICIATIISMFIPSILKRVKYLRKFYFLYGFLGLFLLFMVFGIGNVTNGAKISLDLLFISVQPSEFVKISFVLFISGILYKESNFINVFISGIIAGAHILVLVLSRDLGTALIFFLTYVFIVFVVTGKLIYLITGFTAFIGASFLAYTLFDHVKVRVMAWMDPWSIIDGRGYQVTQSLFGIGTGGFFGMGYFKGDPKLIPVVDQDFIFSAIAEELGGFFALLLIFLYFNLFIVFIRIAFRCSDTFYKTTAFGLGVIMAVQVFLTIGGAIKLIPSTGVTMPLISYGGSSVVATVIIFGILQSFYINEVREGLEDGK